MLTKKFFVIALNNGAVHKWRHARGGVRILWQGWSTVCDVTLARQNLLNFSYFFAVKSINLQIYCKSKNLQKWINLTDTSSFLSYKDDKGKIT